MRGRSSRIPSNDPPDDWGDGSWIVDCVCGVNYDDGEEMVNCDECGVWVHTRCSRFVKGEELFACDKCKMKNNKSRNENENEETEVAQLLVELPTKTVRMGNNSYHAPVPAPPPPRSSLRLWTDMPIEERAHVQGVPGGDPSLFQGLSSIFTPQLWKCTGYVPKKFNFKYKEFPCWEDDEKEEEGGGVKVDEENGKQGVDAVADVKLEEENENPVDRGADALFSLSKEVLPASPRDMLVGLRGSINSSSRETAKYLQKEMKRRESNDTSDGPALTEKREKIHIRPFGVSLGKRKKDETRGSKDHNAKKKFRSVDKEVDSKKRACTPAFDAPKNGTHRDGGVKVAVVNVQEIMNGDKKETGFQGPNTDGCARETKDYSKLKEDVAANTHPAEESSKEALKSVLPVEAVGCSEKVDHQDPAKTGSSPETGAISVPLSEPNGVGSVTGKEVCNMTVGGLNHFEDKKTDRDLNESSSSAAMNSHKLKSSVADLKSSAPAVRDEQIQDSNDSMLNSLQPNIVIPKANTPLGDPDLPFSPTRDVNIDSSKHLDQHQDISVSTYPSEKFEVDEAIEGNLLSAEHKPKDCARESDTVSYCDEDIIAEGMKSISGEPDQLGEEMKRSAGPFSGEESSSELNHGTKNVEALAKIEGMKPSSPISINQCKVVIGIGKSSSTSSTVTISKSDVAGVSKPPGRPASSDTVRLVHSSKQRVKVNSYANSKKDHTAAAVDRDDSRCKISRKSAGEQPKHCGHSGVKTSHLSRNAYCSSYKRTLSDSKEPVHNSSSKAPVTQNVATPLGSAEAASAMQTESVSDVQSKPPTSGFPPKGERFNNSQHFSKVNNSSPMRPPAPVNSCTALSDEELALLLHQELNSSPRVPRVPRVRNASSTPQVTSPTATNLLIKRSSSSGGKDHISVPRRKGKEDAPKDGHRNSREIIDESKKMDNLRCSPDLRRQDAILTSDGPRKREACSPSPEAVHSKKTWPATSTNSIGPSSSAEASDQNLTSIRQSPRVNSDDDDAVGNSGLATRTLPGLINEIMSSGKRMSYDELCNAVLPHWHNLRKHNGERYAYSTHSQAVLDCLRNRNEWAQLVDRGPKTSGGGKKRRKLDSELSQVESEENEYVKGRISKEFDDRNIESHREDFPKGKRKARKRRRLALQGRGINDARTRGKVDGSTDEDVSHFSHSSEGTEDIFSEDDSRGARTCPVGVTILPSSDEAGSV